MSYDIFVVDAFTSVPYRGNPAAVCLLPPGERFNNRADDAMFLTIAAEMNLSETAFVQPLDYDAAAGTDGDSLAPFREARRFHLRWFTPTVEVSLCGHATIATAAVLLGHARLWPHGSSHPTTGEPWPSQLRTLIFETRSGTLAATPSTIDGKLAITLDFPANPPHPLLLAPAVGLEPVGSDAQNAAVQAEPWLLHIVARVLEESRLALSMTLPVDSNAVERLCELHYSPGTKKLILLLHAGATEADLRSLKPKASRLMEVRQPPHTRTPITGVSVTLQGGDVEGSYAYCSRYFAPWNGIDEDPVNGSSHTALACLWEARLQREGQRLRARMASSRGGEMFTRVVARGGGASQNCA